MAGDCCCNVTNLPLHRVHRANHTAQPGAGSCSQHQHPAPTETQPSKPSSTVSAQHATLVPSSPLDPIQDLILSPSEIPTAIRLALGSSEAAPLFSAELARDAKVYWVEQPEAQTNERIQRSTGLSTIRGDALVLYSPAAAATSDAANADSASAGAPSADSASPTVHFSGHWFESPTPHPHRPRSAHASAEGQGVDILPVSILQDIFGRLSFSHLSACAAVCSLWRIAVSQDELLLLSLPIQRRTFKTPLAMPALPTRRLLPGRTGAHPPTRLPLVLRRAAEAGNLMAMVLVGEEMQTGGEGVKAIDWFRKAARKGHQGSQYAVGAAYYRGQGEVQRDGEEALAWLLRAAKNPNGDDRLIAAAALLLGYMYLDGEGTHRTDNSEAVKWLQTAAQLGCLEAQKTVGWLWNTGQY